MDKAHSDMAAPRRYVMNFLLIVSLGVFVLAGIPATVMGAAQAQTLPVAQDAAPVEARTVQTDTQSRVFGEWIFGGQFAAQSFIGFNPSYEVAAGDLVALQMWGGFEFTGSLHVDAQGNIFIPKVGPVKVMGVHNRDLNQVVTDAVKKTFRKNVGVYASLEGAEPVKVFVTGFVNQPGLYAGHSSDSILFFLDSAGGVDPDRGSFLNVKVMREGALHRTINLYDFILTGALPQFQIADGDTVVVEAVQARASVKGEVQNPAFFEFAGKMQSGADILALARPLPNATHVRIRRNNRVRTEIEYLTLADAAKIPVFPGDVLEVTSDKLPGNISVRVEGEHVSQQEFILPYGARLGDLLAKIDFGENAQRNAVQLHRISVKERQREMLDAQLRALESSVLTARSNTTEEALLRAREAELILKWVERARKVEPKGQVSLAGSEVSNDILLEPGDIVRIPRTSNLVMVHGDVLFPSAMAFQGASTVEDYIKMAGGFTQGSGNANVLILHRDGTFQKVKRRDLDNHSIKLLAGDEIFVLPRVATKNVQVAKDIISIFYQLALSAGVVLRL